MDDAFPFISPFPKKHSKKLKIETKRLENMKENKS